MPIDTPHLWNFLLALLAMLNPIGKVPIWVQVSKGCPAAVRLRLAALVTGTATALLLLFLLCGGAILEFLGLGVAGFRVGGGIVILLLGLEMLKGKGMEIHGDEPDRADDPLDRAKARFRDIAVPVAMPVLAGPGSITTVMMYGFRAEGWVDRSLLAGALVLLMAAVFGILLVGHELRRLVGDLVLDVQTRIWGLLLTCIAAQLVLTGLGETFPAWTTSSGALSTAAETAAPALSSPQGEGHAVVRGLPARIPR